MYEALDTRVARHRQCHRSRWTASIRQHTYAYVCIRTRSRLLVHVTAVDGRRAYVSIREHTHTSALDTRVARHRQCHRSRRTRHVRRSSAPCRAAHTYYVSILIRILRQRTHTHTTSAYASIISAVPRCMRILRQHTHTHTTPAYAYAHLLTHSIRVAYAYAYAYLRCVFPPVALEAVTARGGPPVYIRQHSSAYAYVCIRIRSSPQSGRRAGRTICVYTSAYVSIRIRQHTSAYAFVSIRQHTHTQ